MKSFFYHSIRLSIAAMIAIVFSCQSHAQIFSKNNFVIIESTDSHSDIIRKAANVTPSSRQLEWQELEVTGFISFGIHIFTGREWGDGSENPKDFNPTELDARQWARIFKEAVIRQLILTTKHHDEFCLWPSAYTEHSLKKSPWKEGKGD